MGQLVLLLTALVRSGPYRAGSKSDSFEPLSACHRNLGIVKSTSFCFDAFGHGNQLGADLVEQGLFIFEGD